MAVIHPNLSPDYRWMILIMLTAMAVMELLPKIPTPTRASIRTKPAVVLTITLIPTLDLP